MARFCPLYSGSSGNSTFVGFDDGGILIDAGVSCKKIVSGLNEINQLPENIKGIFITHEHSDHISGLNVFLKKYKTPIYATEATLQHLLDKNKIPKNARVNVVKKSGNIVYGMNIVPFKTSHDALDSVGYKINTKNDVTMCLVTDLGYISDEVRGSILGSDLVMIESNYDERMLENGPYHRHLKNRVKGAKGHLSNKDCAKAVLDLVKNGTTRIILGHLSSNNNRLEIAYSTTSNALLENNFYYEKDYILTVANKNEVSKVIYI